MNLRTLIVFILLLSANANALEVSFIPYAWSFHDLNGEHYANKKKPKHIPENPRENHPTIGLTVGRFLYATYINSMDNRARLFEYIQPIPYTDFQFNTLSFKTSFGVGAVDGYVNHEKEKAGANALSRGYRGWIPNYGLIQTVSKRFTHNFSIAADVKYTHVGNAEMKSLTIVTLRAVIDLDTKRWFK